jgi:hypothetical protein
MEDKMKTIGNVRPALTHSITDAVREHLPQTAGFSIEIDIFENDRKKRSDASQNSWQPARGEIRIRFVGSTRAGLEEAEIYSQPDHNGQTILDSSSSRSSQNATGLQIQVELIHCLRKAETRPGFEFVSLKWFRDLFLPAQEYEWSRNPTDRDRAIRTAIEEGIIRTHKVPNPKNPAFPVTAVRLNLQHPEVSAAMGDEIADTSSFVPVDIKGEPLSDTVLRDRR